MPDFFGKTKSKNARRRFDKTKKLKIRKQEKDLNYCKQENSHAGS